MPDDLFHLIRSLEHEYREENGERVHSYRCIRCALSVRMSDFKAQVTRLLRDMEFIVGDPVEKTQDDK